MHTSSSHISITFNITSTKPTKTTTFSFEMYPDNAICPGESLIVRSVITDNTGEVHPEISQNIKWRIIDSIPGSYNADEHLSSTSVREIRFTPTRAYSTDLLEGTLEYGTITLRDTVAINVTPCYPEHLIIEASPTPT